MRILLTKERDLNYSIGEDIVARQLVRIVGVYIGDKQITFDKFIYKGPRRVQLKEDPGDQEVYGKVMEYKTANRIMN